MHFDKDRLKANGRFRSLDRSEKPGYLDFSSNDSLGLSQNSALLEAFNVFPVSKFGASGSRLLGGDNPIFHECETLIASDLGKEAALFFSSGFQLNTGVLPALFGPDDVIFMDKLAHASLIDGARLSAAKLIRYKHNDMAHLALLLDKHRNTFKQAVIVTESLFSMNGDLSDLAAIITLKKHFHTSLMVDDAHSIGSCGPDGLGLARPFSPDIDYLIGTFGKALGSSGAYVATSRNSVEQLINTSRSFIYSTGLPLPVMHWNLLAWKKLKELEPERQHLRTLAKQLRTGVPSHYTVLGTQHIVPVIMGDSQTACDMSERLLAASIIAPAIRPPTVPEGQARLRFSVKSIHTMADIQGVINALS